jgi:formylglycine-generating enzyme required for sulfatase activity
MAKAFDPYHVWLGIPPEEQPPNHYRLLGINLFEGDPEVIDNAADRQMVHLRSFQLSKYADLSQTLLNEVAAAKVCLLRPEKKAAYDQQLRQQLAAPAEAAENLRPEIDSQLALVLAREAQTRRGAAARSSRAMPRSPDRATAKPSRVAILGSAGSIAVLLAIAAAWAIFGRKSPDTGVRATDPKTEISNRETQIPHPNSLAAAPQAAVPGRPSKIQNPESKIAASAPPLAKPSMSAAEAAQVQQQWAEHLGRPVKETNSLGMPLVLIPPGEFDMGSTPEEVAWARQMGTTVKDQQWLSEQLAATTPRHRVKISRPFYLGIYPVTQDEYERVTGANPSRFARKPMDAAAFKPPLSQEERRTRELDAKNVPAGCDTKRHPVEMISWDDAAEFCRRLSSLPAECGAKRSYRLPSEAEWEYACRAGTTTYWHFGDDPAGLRDAAWFSRNAGGMTHPVGEKRPNAWGLCEMYGNVNQWCRDWYRRDEYQHAPPSDPGGPPAGRDRVLRGGYWANYAYLCRSARRNWLNPSVRHPHNGIRAVADIPMPPGILRPPSRSETADQRTAPGAVASAVPTGPDSKTPVAGRQSSVPPTAGPSMSTAAAVQVQRQWAEHLGLPVSGTNSIGMPLVLIPPGEFDMGSTPEETAWAVDLGGKSKEYKSYLDRAPSEAPRHRVRITRPFYLGTYAVTQAEYEKVVGVNPSTFTSRQLAASAFRPPLPVEQVKYRSDVGKRMADKDTSRHPAEMVSWEEAAEFCRILSAMPAEQAAQRVYRLPTEAEWEYACRAGTTTHWYCGDDEAALAQYAWLNANAGGTTHPVGEKLPNAWGLYDLYGNVSQWCADWFGADYYKQSPPSDPTGPPTGAGRLHRGGSYHNSRYYRSAYRPSDGPATRAVGIGFRVLAELTAGK